jgi:phosphotriesterase-related protein
VGDPGSVIFRNYNFIFTDFIPALKKEGFTKKDIDIIFINNPSEAFSIRVRKIPGRS